MWRALRLVGRLLRWSVYAVLVTLLLIVLAVVILQTGWGKNQLRALIVREANQYLTATLNIGRLQGSLVRGIELSEITLTRNGRTLISIGDVSVSYSIRELFGPGTSIREIRIARPNVVAEKEADGHWNLAGLIRRDTRVAERRGPGRPIQIRSIEVSGGTIRVREPLDFGAAHLPTAYDNLNLMFALDYQPVAWKAVFASASFVGSSPDLRVNRFSGSISDGADGWLFDRLLVETPRSHLVLDGRVDRRTPPVRLPLRVDAERFAFQEWSGILPGLKNIAIESQFNVQLDGPLAALQTNLTLRSNGGNVGGGFVLNTTTPGWQVKGAVDVERLNLAHWLNRPDRPSNITAHATFALTDVGLHSGGHFPLGMYAVEGSHIEYLDYAADSVKAHGLLTETDARIESATLVAYGATLSLSAGSIGIHDPNTFQFVGTARDVDLTKLPERVPISHVESQLGLDFDVTGQFTSEGFIKGRAEFVESTFLGARVGAGSFGFVDTSLTPFEYSGEGDLGEVNLHRFGVDLGVEWLQEPRYAGTVTGHFHVSGAGKDLDTMTLAGGGHLARADLFGGQLTDAEMLIEIHDGSLSASYDGHITNINPALALDDKRYDASLTGSGIGKVEVQDLLVRSPVLNDFRITTELMLEASRVRTVALDSATMSGILSNGTLTLDQSHVVSPAIDLQAMGRVALTGNDSSQLDYTIARGDVALVKDLFGYEGSGEIATTGQLTGPPGRIHLVGTGTITQIGAFGLQVASGALNYDATVPTDAPRNTIANVDGRLSSLQVFGEEVQEATGRVSYDAGRIVTDVQLQRPDLHGSVAGVFQLHVDEKRLDISELTLGFQRSSWKLAEGAPLPHLNWNDRGVVVSSLALVDQPPTGQRLAIDGPWYPDGGSNLHVTAANVSLDALMAESGAPARFGGTANVDAFVRGSRERPTVTGELTVTEGRVWRVSYERLAGRVDYADGALEIDVRLDEAPGAWLTAVGHVPLGMFYPDMPERPVNVRLTSSTVDLGLLEGLTTVVSNVGGTVTFDVNVVGTTRDPHFEGRIDVANANFLVGSSGAKYRNGRLAAELSTDRVIVETLRLEDSSGHALEVQGSLGTHELRVGELAITGTARQFEVLRNQYGRLNIDANVSLTGQFEMPRVAGRITVSSGELNVDRILDRTMLQPYSTEAAPTAEADAFASLNPWNRLGLDLELRVPNTLRLLGDNIQISPGTAIGLGSINLRALGDLYLYKDPAQPLSVTGSLDQITGRVRFQGRRFDLDPASSVTFRGDLNPELYVTVTREITGVQARVTIAGPLDTPELHLASTPPLDQSDILSLIVFNTTTNQLSSLQQQQLAVRAGTLAAGFVAAPLISALERTLGIDTLEIEPTSTLGGGSGARVTVGAEIAPGLVARFTRNFGVFEYNEASIEFYLSRIFRIRATFTDAASTAALNPFRVVERAGVDLLLFFSF